MLTSIRWAPLISSSPTLLRSHHLDDLNKSGRGLTMMTNVKANQIRGQRVGGPIWEKDSQNAYIKPARR